MKNPWVIIGILIVVLFGGAMWFSNASNERNNEGVEVLTHVKGNPDAAVVLTEYSDLQCPACAAFAPVISDMLETYGDAVRFEYKHYPLVSIHPFALNAAIAAEAAGQQGKFFEYHDLLFANQQQWSSSAIPTGAFMAYAEELGLDVELFERHMKSTVLRDKVRAELDAARELGLTSTPSFFLNGQRMQFSTYEEFLAQIAAAVDPNAVSTSTPALDSEVRFGI